MEKILKNNQNVMAQIQDQKLTLTKDSIIYLYPLTKRKEGSEYIVGKKSGGKFIALPEIGIKIISLLEKELPLQKVEEILKEELGQPVNVTKFIEQLLALNFISGVDDTKFLDNKNNRETLSFIKAEHISWLFSWPIKLIITLLILDSIVTLFKRPDLLPTYDDFFWFPYTSVVILGNHLFSMLLLLLHETMHLIAARSYEIPGTMHLGTRLHQLVIQTDVTGLWSVPARKRIRVYVAGMALNAVFIALGILLLAYMPVPLLLSRIVRTIILLNFFAILFEFYVYMRTDVYFIFLHLLRCYNLFEDSLAYGRYLISLVKKTLHLATRVNNNPLLAIPSREHLKIKLYLIVICIGSLLSVGTFIFYRVPIIITIYGRAFASMVHSSLTVRPLSFFDGFITFTVGIIFWILYFRTFLRSHPKVKEWLLVKILRRKKQNE